MLPTFWHDKRELNLKKTYNATFFLPGVKQNKNISRVSFFWSATASEGHFCHLSLKAVTHYVSVTCVWSQASCKVGYLLHLTQMILKNSAASQNPLAIAKVLN